MAKTPTLYRTPRKPGYLGGYNWRATASGLLFLLIVNVVATQYIAARFGYQAALGPPLLATARRRSLSTICVGYLGMALFHGPRYSHSPPIL